MERQVIAHLRARARATDATGVEQHRARQFANPRARCLCVTARRPESLRRGRQFGGLRIPVTSNQAAARRAFIRSLHPQRRGLSAAGGVPVSRAPARVVRQEPIGV